MPIFLTSLEHSFAPIALRERLSFTRHQAASMMQTLCEDSRISGCVLLSTCNRTELYISTGEHLNPAALLCSAAGCDALAHQDIFLREEGDRAIAHLMEVAAGLRSRIWGEDQIISQVKDAILLSREADCADSTLEALFRAAIAAGKEVRSRVRLNAVPTSAAAAAVALLQQQLGSLSDKRAIVIGNGEMGRLSASLLQQAGCAVSVTLRTYRHGETIIPAGCCSIPYEERFTHMDGADLVLSATVSPHYTVTADLLSHLAKPPRLLVDLAIPRDIEPKVGELAGTALFNIDDLGDFSTEREIPPEVTEILDTHTAEFHRWLNYKNCLSSKDGLKDAILERLTATAAMGGALSEEELLGFAVDKTVDLLLGGLAGSVTAEQLLKCEEKIRSHTIKRKDAR